jgi:DNA polymerase/3'-5' exonuclease PolX
VSTTNSRARLPAGQTASRPGHAPKPGQPAACLDTRLKCYDPSWSHGKTDRPDLPARPATRLQLDLFLAQPDNWGLTLLVRTGSAAFSTAMLARWKRRQGIGRDQPGSVDGRLVTPDGRAVPTPEEESVFRLVGMQPVPPERRSGVEW